MAYVIQTWKDGDTVTAKKLNHMEYGIGRIADYTDGGIADITVNDDNTLTLDYMDGTEKQTRPLSAGQTYVHNQSVASSVWIITHNLDKYVTVTVVDSAGTQVIGEVRYLDSNSVEVSFQGAFAGKAYCN